MQRREFIKAIAGSAVAWPLAAKAQQPTMPVVGFINAAAAQDYKRQLAAFLKGLGETGYIEGHNVTIEYRWAEGNNDRAGVDGRSDRSSGRGDCCNKHPRRARSQGRDGLRSDRLRNRKRPDPARSRQQLSRPGGNVTGVTSSAVEVAQKRLELLHQLFPTARVMALLVNPAEPTIAKATASEVLVAARTFGLEVHVLNASSESDFDEVFAKLVQLKASALIISGGPFFVSHREQLAALTLRHAVPAVFPYREFAAAGGLLTYGSDIADSYRLAGVYTGRILKGDKPAELPVQQAAKVELSINLKTAKTLGITVPNTLIGRADEVFE